MSFCEQDLMFLRSAGADISGGERWRVLKRSGRMLLMIPEDGIKAKDGLRLYQPQRFIARSIVQLLRCIPLSRRFLPAIQMSYESGGALETILADTDTELCAVLLGNPTQEERRMILLLKSTTGELQVVKLGVGEMALAKIVAECSVLKTCEDRLGKAGRIPRCICEWPGESWAAFSTVFFPGSPEFCLDAICATLEEWLEDTPKEVAGFSGWSSMLERCESDETRASLVERSKGLRLFPTLRHGDFTPWNILRGEGDKMVVIDWEFADFSDVPGWDLVHYLILEAQLVQRLSPTEVIKSALRNLSENAGAKSYLIASGWSKSIDTLMVSYLVYMDDELEGCVDLLDALSLLRISDTESVT